MNIDPVRENLLKSYSSREYGTWEILGEDPNCDFSGPHSQPRLMIVTGTYHNVIEYALSLKGFIQWGTGGSINKIIARLDVDHLYSAEAAELKNKKAKLEKELAEISSKLEKIYKK